MEQLARFFQNSTATRLNVLPALKRGVVTVRSAVLWVMLVSLTLFLGMFAMIIALFKAENTMHRLATLWGSISAALCGAKLRIVNKENLREDGSTLILSNHQSIVDIIFFYAVFKTQFRWMAKADLFDIPIFGHAMTGAGYVPVERGDRQKARDSLYKAAAQVKAGKSIIMFPEGTTGRADGSMLPFKKGSFILAKKAEAYIQPVTVWGPHNMVPDDKNNWMQRVYPCEILFYIHEPIAPEDYAHMSSEELSAHVRNIIEGPLKEKHLSATAA